VNCDKYAITFDGYDDSQPDSLEFRYLVSVDPGTCGLGDWILQLPGCVNKDTVLSAGPGNWEFVKSSSTWGIKFKNSIDAPQSGKPANTVLYYLRLNGPFWSPEEMQEMTAVIEAHGESCEKVVEFPGCPVTS
jgi:hypothetical protein